MGSLFLVFGLPAASYVVQDQGYEEMAHEPSQRFETSGRVSGAAADAVGTEGMCLVCALSTPSKIISGTAQLLMAHTVGAACGGTSTTDTVAGAETVSPSGLLD